MHWDARTLDVITEFEIVHSAAVNALNVSPDGLQVASGSDDSYVIVWNMDDGSFQTNYIANSPIYGVAWSSDNWRLAFITGSSLTIWNTDS